MNDSLDPALQEMRDRLRRMETRMTRWLQMQGLDLEQRPPQIARDRLMVYSPHTSLREISELLARDYMGKTVPIVYRGETILTVMVPGENYATHATTREVEGD